MARPIAACQRCAGTSFRIPGLRDGIIPETDNLGEWTCARCDLRATPLYFDDVDDYAAFARDKGHDISAGGDSGGAADADAGGDGGAGAGEGDGGGDGGD